MLVSCGAPHESNPRHASRLRTRNSIGRATEGLGLSFQLLVPVHRAVVLTPAPKEWFTTNQLHMESDGAGQVAFAPRHCTTHGLTLHRDADALLKLPEVGMDLELITVTDAIPASSIPAPLTSLISGVGDPSSTCMRASALLGDQR